MPEPRDVHRQASNVLSIILIVLGVLITIRTLAQAGGPDGFALGFLLGPLFVAAGIGRIYINKRLPRGGGGGGGDR
jgi:uncharacterized transporter YbjL